MQYLESNDPTLQNIEKIPEEFYDPVHHQALAFEYFSDAYVAFFNGADVFEEQDKALEARYSELSDLDTYSLFSHLLIAKKNEKTLSDLEAKKERLVKFKAELSQLQSSEVRLCLLYHNYLNTFFRHPWKNSKRLTATS